jgi:signal transduction histidine kinase/ActR/RegA family two-component response regulator
MKTLFNLVIILLISSFTASYAANSVDSLKAIVQNGDDTKKASAYFELAEIAKNKKDFTSASQQYVESMRLADIQKNRLLQGKTRLGIGQIYLQQGNEENALTNLNRSLEYFNEEKNNDGVAEVNKCLGDLYVTRKIYGKAKDHFKAAMDIWIGQGQQQKAADISAYIGNVVQELADYEGALTYFQTSLDLNGSVNNMPNIARDMTSMVGIHIKQGNYEQAHSMITAAKDIRNQLKDDYGLAELTILEAALATDEKDKSKAAQLLTSAQDMLSKLTVVPGVEKQYLKISEIYKSLDNNDLAYKFALQYADVKDKVQDILKSQSMMELTTRYESEFESRAQLEQIHVLQEKEAAAKTKIFFLFALIALAGALAYSFYRSAQIKKKDNLILQSKNDEINEQKQIVSHQNDLLADKNVALDSMNMQLVTEIGKRETIEQNTFARDSFLAAISAQMRTPINHINGLTHLLLDSNPNTEQLEQLRALQFSSNDLVVFINDILDYSKIEASKINVENRPFSSTKILTEIKNRFDNSLKIKNIAFDFESINVPETLVGDPSRLNQILSNLLHNASSHTQEGSIKTTVEFVPQNGVDSHLKLSIRDTGQGLNPEEVSSLQRKFSTDDANWYGSNERALKLAIAKRLIELQNGSFELRTNTNDGTLVFVTLPFKIAEKDELKLANSLFDERKMKLKNKRVLLVEDNKINQLVVTKMLQKDGVIVTVADDGLLGLEKVKSDSFDLILMDIQMPNMDGYRATAEIRRLVDATKKDIPIIALTASAYLTEKEKAQLFGMNDHIGKPFSPDELIDKMIKVIA